MKNKILITFFLIFITAVQAEVAEFILPDIEEYQLDNGMRVLISSNYESPTINVSIQINAGKLDGPEDKPGLAASTFYQLNDATIKYPKKNQLENKLFSLGDNKGNFNNFQIYDDYAWISHVCLKEDTRDCIEIFAEVLQNPTFPFFNKFLQKLTLMWAPKSVFSSVGSATWKHAKYMLNGQLHYFHPLKSDFYKRKEVLNWYNLYIRPENTTIMISGDINYIYIKKLIDQFFTEWNVKTTRAFERKEYNINITDTSGIDVQFTSFEDKNEARILILKKSTELNDFWDPAMQMAQYVFAKNRREKIHQKIDKSGWIGYGWEQSNRMPYFYIQSEINYNYLNHYYSEMLSEFNNLSNNSITKEELNAAKKTRINDYQNKVYDITKLNSFILYYYGRNGYSLEQISKMMDDIRNVTLEEVNEAAQKVFDPYNFIMTIAGNKDSCYTFLDQFSNVEYYERSEEIRASDSRP